MPRARAVLLTLVLTTLVLGALFLALPPGALARPTLLDRDAILAVLSSQQAAWNAGNLDAFATGYKNAPDILFIGKTLRRGYAEMLAGYRKSYGNREKMGQLRFSGLSVQPLDAQFATVTGNFALTRTAAGGGDAGGFFLLVLEKTSAGWKIVRDDTTAGAALAAK